MPIAKFTKNVYNGIRPRKVAKNKKQKKRGTHNEHYKNRTHSHEKEKLLAYIGVVAKDFEIKRYKAEMELNKIEKDGGRDERLIDLLEHYINGQNFYYELEHKIKQAIENNQL